MPRDFRKLESLETERRVRAALIPFLQDRGFEIENPAGSAQRVTGQMQLVRARDEQGRQVMFWVKLCWRKNSGSIENARSAGQLMARVKRGPWEPQIQAKVDRAAVKGATHLVMVQNSGSDISIVAAIPLEAVVPIWSRQREESRRLIEDGTVHHTKNHAENGSSPTLWVRDEHANSVAQELWDYEGVRDLAALPPRHDASSSNIHDDSEADLPDYSNLGSDGAPRVQMNGSGVRRDPRVRAAVLRRSGRSCERPACAATRDFPGFFDVHHILGAEKGDRVWNCVTLCPNCHREAHYSPNGDELNDLLLKFASRWKPPKSKSG